MFSILGNGHWGGAIANYLAKNHDLELIGRTLKPLPKQSSIKQSTGWTGKSSVLIYASPSHLAHELLKPIFAHAQPPKICLIASKGLMINESGNVETLSSYVSKYTKKVAVISGPSFAKELLAECPTFLVGATTHPSLAQELKQWFQFSPISLNQSEDVFGVSIAGAFKNPVAILMGYLDAFVNSANMRFAVMSYANDVLAKVLVKLGGQVETAYGYAGQGDLFMTCLTDLSRNRHMGQLLAEGLSMGVAEKKVGSVVEGIQSLAHLRKYCDQSGFTVPLLELIDQVINQKLSQDEVVVRLVNLMNQNTMQAVKSLVV